MAFLSSMIRRSVSSFGPVALQIQRHYSRFAFAAKITHVNDGDNGRSLIPRFRFSTEPTKCDSDESILRDLDEKIKSTAKSGGHSRVDELLGAVPFIIKDNLGDSCIHLKRTHQDEDILVLIHRASLVKLKKFGIYRSAFVTVFVSKKTGKLSMDFTCKAYANKIVIESLSVTNRDDGVKFESGYNSDLDKDMQKSLLKYLEIRGINSSTISLLNKYAIDKGNDKVTNYLSWLEKVKKYVEA